MKKFFSFIMVIVLMFTSVLPCVYAIDEVTVSQVEEMLESIDTLQQMQDKRNSYTVNKHYNANNASVVAAHQKARNGYETYLEEMFKARASAQKAYDALSDAEKAQIPASLSDKLVNRLDTVFNVKTFPITKSDNEYTYQLISPDFMVYEVSSSYIKTGDVAGTFVLIDTTTSGDTWTPDGLYEYGKVNYDLSYCCDLLTLPTDGTHYKITNLENSDYYDASSAEKIRAITEISYPFLTIDEMKEELIKSGLDSDFVATLTRSDLITSAQMAIWAYANVNDETFNFDNVTHYGGTLRMKNHPYIPKIMHDYTNECWTWWSQKSAYRTFDERTESRVNRLVEHLCSLTPVKTTHAQTVITQLDVVKTELTDYKNNIYDITMHIALNGGSENDDLRITAVSYSENEDGSRKVTGTSDFKAVLKNGTYAFDISAKDGDMIELTVQGTQNLPKGAYFYDAGSREKSQSMVGITEGPKAVKVSKNTLFVADMVKVPVEDIEISATEISLSSTEELQLAVTVKPEDATFKDIVFHSDNESVATVDEKGNITAIAPGTATITVTSVDNPSIKKEIIVTVTEPVAEPDPIIPAPVIPRKHYICFGKTDGIGWYEVSVNGGDFFPQGPNSTLEVEEGSVLVVRVQDMWIDDEFDFYVNGSKVPMDPANTITVVVDGYMLIGALSMDTEVPDIEESLTLLEKIIKAFKDFFAWIASWFE